MATTPRIAVPVAPRPIVVEQPPAEPKAAPEPESASDPIVMESDVKVVPEVAEPEVAEPERFGATAPPDYARITPPPVIPRRTVAEDAGRGDVPWLGIGSWLLLCGALFASLIGWPSQTSLDRVSQFWSDSVSNPEQVVRSGQDETPPVQSAALPDDARTWTALPDTGGDPQTLPPTELAPPIEPGVGNAIQRIPGGPPLPQFKPIVDGVAAKFSNAFFEIGERLQEEGDTDAAVHMRQQGSNLDPWQGSGGSEL